MPPKKVVKKPKKAKPSPRRAPRRAPARVKPSIRQPVSKELDDLKQKIKTASSTEDVNMLIKRIHRLLDENGRTVKFKSSVREDERRLVPRDDEYIETGFRKRPAPARDVTQELRLKPQERTDAFKDIMQAPANKPFGSVSYGQPPAPPPPPPEDPEVKKLKLEVEKAELNRKLAGEPPPPAPVDPEVQKLKLEVEKAELQRKLEDLKLPKTKKTFAEYAEEGTDKDLEDKLIKQFEEIYHDRYRIPKAELKDVAEEATRNVDTPGGEDDVEIAGDFADSFLEQNRAKESFTLAQGKILAKKIARRLMENADASTDTDGGKRLRCGGMDALAGTDEKVNITPTAIISKLPENAPPVLRNFLNEWGDATIFKMRIVRKPISKAIETLANAFTLGKFNKSKTDLNIDRYFHLFIEFALKKPDGQIEHVLLEKNQKIDLQKGRPGGLGPGEEARQVSVPSGLTFGEFLKNAEDRVDKNRLWVYSATSNNCQRFVADLLESNGISFDKSFVLQEVSAAVPGYLKSVMGFATNTANRLRTLLRGRGRPENTFKIMVGEPR